MSSKYASAKNSIAECDVCGFIYKLTKLKALVRRAKPTNILACPQCWTPDQPQNMQGMYPVSDPQAVKNPRPDNTYYISGVDTNGYFGEGSRIIDWGWNPVGGSNGILTSNNLLSYTVIGNIEIT